MNTGPGKTMYAHFKKTNGMAKPCMYTSMKLVDQNPTTTYLYWSGMSKDDPGKESICLGEVYTLIILPHFDNKNINNWISVKCHMVFSNDIRVGGGGGTLLKIT